MLLSVDSHAKVPLVVGTVLVPALTTAVEDCASLISTPQLLRVVPHLKVSTFGTGLLDLSGRLNILFS